MKAILLGLIFFAAAVLAMIPAGLGWWADVLVFLRGALPVIAILIGLIALFIGIADLRDKAAARKETPEDAG
jgi:hypothetical protein